MLGRNLKDCEKGDGSTAKFGEGKLYKEAQRPWVDSFVWYYVLDKGDAQRLQGDCAGESNILNIWVKKKCDYYLNDQNNRDS